MDNAIVSQKKKLSELVQKLSLKGYNTNILNSDKEVKDFINRNIPDKCIVGLGNSITTCKLNIRHILATKGSTIFYGYDGTEYYNRSLDTFESLPGVDYYISRINALTPEGNILMKDFSKVAVERNSFPKHIFAFAGINRITEIINIADCSEKYSVFSKKPENIEFTINILPYLHY